jgi:hypothetical protein
MNRMSRNLTTVYRTERLIARRRLAVVQKQSVLIALAALTALAGLVLLDVALYFALTTRLSPAGSAGILAFANFILAGLLAIAAGRTSVEDEIAPAVEVRDMAIADIEVEIEDVAQEARDFVDAVKGLGANPLGAAATLIVPILTAGLKKGSG